MDKLIAFKCGRCGKVSIFPVARQDGRRCIECNGYLFPIGFIADNQQFETKKLYDSNGNIVNEMTEYRYPRVEKNTF